MARRRAPKQPRKRRATRTTVRAVAATSGQGVQERVLALDSSSKAVGWSVFDDGQLMAHSRYLQEGGGHGEKLAAFRRWLLDMLVTWRPHRLIFEAPYPGRMRNTYGILTRYVGVIEAVHFEYFGCEVPKDQAVAAHLVKRAIQAPKGSDHDANKRIVIRLVNRRYGLRLRYYPNDTTKKLSQDDEADGIALNWAWHVLHRGTGEAV